MRSAVFAVIFAIGFGLTGAFVLMPQSKRSTFVAAPYSDEHVLILTSVAGEVAVLPKPYASRMACEAAGNASLTPFACVPAPRE